MISSNLFRTVLWGVNCIAFKNQTYVVPIPMSMGAQTVKDFRPISVCNGLYKILAKILSSRFKESLKKIISPEQSAFLRGRQIMDNVALVMDSIRTIM